MANLYCPKCRKTMVDTNYYTYKDGTKCELCKACLTMFIDNFDPETFKWALEKFDVPYLYWEWNALRDKAYAKDPYKMNGMSVFGKYLSKMKLKQFSKDKNGNPIGWIDTQRLTEEHEREAALHANVNQVSEEKIAEMEEAFHNGEITEAQLMTYKLTQDRDPEFVMVDGAITTVKGGNPYPVNDNPFEKVDLPDMGADLTEEDKIYLATKWGRLYSAADWVSLEGLYNEYDKSFDLHNADLLAGIKQVCKLDLKCNQALDSGDVDSYSKLARAADSLRKSLKLTEAQRKEEKNSSLSCYGQLVSYCERKTGYIPKIDLTIDRDVVDKDLRDIKTYTKNLIEEDPAVFKQIEQYIKKREILMEQEKDAEAIANGEFELTDEDMAEHNEFIAEQIEEDEENRMEVE